MQKNQLPGTNLHAYEKWVPFTNPMPLFRSKHNYIPTIEGVLRQFFAHRTYNKDFYDIRVNVYFFILELKIPYDI